MGGEVGGLSSSVASTAAESDRASRGRSVLTCGLVPGVVVLPDDLLLLVGLQDQDALLRRTADAHLTTTT